MIKRRMMKLGAPYKNLAQVRIWGQR